MSTSSSRYVKWFGTRVAIVSRGALAIVMLFVSLPLSAVLYISYSFMNLMSDWLPILLSALSVGTLSYFVLLLILNALYKNPSSSPAFLELVGRVLQRILVTSNAQVWIRRSNDAYITSTFNPVFSAVIVSEPMVELILNRPDAGEVLLAYHLARLPRKPWFGDYLGSLVLTVIFTILSVMILVPMIVSMISMMEWYGPLLLLSLMSSLGSSLIIPFFIAYFIKGAFWKHEPAFLLVTEVYGMHPQVAKVEVERGSPLNEEEMQAVIWGVREWEKKRRGSRRLGVSTIVTILLSIFMLFVFASGMTSIPYYFMFLMYLPFAIAIGVGIVVYFILRRWDNNAMAEVFHETTDSHEPIWMD